MLLGEQYRLAIVSTPIRRRAFDKPLKIVKVVQNFIRRWCLSPSYRKPTPQRPLAPTDGIKLIYILQICGGRPHHVLRVPEHGGTYHHVLLLLSLRLWTQCSEVPLVEEVQPIMLLFFWPQGEGLEILQYYTMILLHIRLIVKNAGFVPGTTDSAVFWRSLSLWATVSEALKQLVRNPLPAAPVLTSCQL